MNLMHRFQLQSLHFLIFDKAYNLSLIEKYGLLSPFLTNLSDVTETISISEFFLTSSKCLK